jgi:tripartite-type tricarboxylate transporter receptor subunit TctC
MNLNRRHFNLALGGGAALAALQSLPAFAQVAQPKIYYGFPAGSAGDSLARRVADKLGGSSYARNNAVVENKPGAGGRIVLETLKGSPADGTVLTLAQASALTIYPHVYTKMNYTMQDFTPISIGAQMIFALAVGPMVPDSVKTLQDFVAWAKANPEKSSFGSPGAGSMPHFVGSLFGVNAGITFQHVPFRGSLPAVNDTVGGQIAACVTPTGDSLAHAKGGRLRILAVSAPKRVADPDAPTFAEQGYPEIVAEEWFGFFAPAKTPASIVNAANTAIRAALRDQSVIDGLSNVGLVASGGSTTQAMRASLESEFKRWGPLVKKVGFTAES